MDEQSGQQVTAVLTINVQGKSVAIARREDSQGNNCDYVGTIGADGVSVQGTYQCTVFPSAPSLRATIRCPQCVPSPSNLVSWWRGDGNASDSLGANHGTLRNGAGFTEGNVEQGFLLDGIDDFVEVPNSVSLKADNLTIKTWVKFNSLDTAGDLSPKNSADLK